MRKLNAMNKTLLGIFIFIILVSIALFSIFIFIVSSKEENNKFLVEKNSFVYSGDNKFIVIEEDANIFKKWNDKYYLIQEKEETLLGRHSLVYNTDNYNVTLFGEYYQVNQDGQITYLVNQNEISKSVTPTFYKLADRKYLIISPDINSLDNEFSTKNYLIVEIDKSGNALLINNLSSMKTITPIVLTTSEFEFDIANEKLIIANTKIDLTKIIGSSNEYKTTTTTTTTTTNIVTTQPITEPITQNNFGTGGFSSNKENTSDIVLTKYYAIKGIVPGVNHIKINYLVVDSADEYVSVFALIENNDVVNRIELNKNATEYIIRDLEPNHEYKIVLGYNYFDSDNTTILEQLSDTSVVMTKKLNNSLKFTQIKKNEVKFNLKLDSDYKLNNARLALYIDDVYISSLEVDVNKATTSNGWDSSVMIISSGRVISLVLENAFYNDKQVEVNLKSTYINE